MSQFPYRPPPAFVAELEAADSMPPTSHNGAPVFEMAADPVIPSDPPTRPTTTTTADTTAAPAPANPWPYHAGDDTHPHYKPYSPPAEHEVNRPPRQHGAPHAYQPYRPPGSEAAYPAGAAPHHFYVPGQTEMPIRPAPTTASPTEPSPTANVSPTASASPAANASPTASSPPAVSSPPARVDQGPEPAIGRPATAPPGPAAPPPVPGPGETVLWPRTSEQPLPEVTQGPYQSQDAEVVTAETAPGSGSAGTGSIAAAALAGHPFPPAGVYPQHQYPAAPPQPVYSPQLVSPVGTWPMQPPMSPTYDVAPMSPPPAYTDGPPLLPLRNNSVAGSIDGALAASSGTGSNEKPSLFPQAPSSAPPTATTTPMPQQQQQQQQQQPMSPQQTGTPPTPTPPQQQQFTGYPHPQGQAQGHPPTPPVGYPQPPVPQPTYVTLQPPPLPPRPNSSDGGMPPPPLPPHPSVVGGFGYAVPNVGAYPPPPKTHYVPQQQPSYAYSGSGSGSGSSSGCKTSKLFSSSSAMKWLDKTNQLVEDKLGEFLDGPSRYRPQQQQQQRYGYPQGGQPVYYQRPPGQY